MEPEGEGREGGGSGYLQKVKLDVGKFLSSLATLDEFLRVRGTGSFGGSGEEGVGEEEEEELKKKKRGGRREKEDNDERRKEGKEEYVDLPVRIQLLFQSESRSSEPRDEAVGTNILRLQKV